MRRPVIGCFSQRLVVVAGGNGGSEYQSWKHQTYLPFVRFVLLGQGADRRPEAPIETKEGDTDPQKDGQSARCPAFVGAHEDG